MRLSSILACLYSVVNRRRVGFAITSTSSGATGRFPSALILMTAISVFRSYDLGLKLPLIGEPDHDLLRILNHMIIG